MKNKQREKPTALINATPSYGWRTRLDYNKSPRKTMKTTYKCIHCGKSVNRKSDKKWITSLCEKTGKKVRLQKIDKY